MESIKSQPLSHLIASEIKKSIWSSELKFGQRLLEVELAEKFDVSRSSVREAFKILEHEELVVSKTRKGTYVAQFTKKDCKELIEFRLLLEVHAFIQASQKLTETDRKELQKILDNMATTTVEGSWNDLFDLDMKLHCYIVGKCGNSRIKKAYESIQMQIRTLLSRLDRYYPSYNSFYQEHRELLEAVMTKDLERIEHAVYHHIKFTEEKIINFLTYKKQ